jgi:hypothetical protein
MQAAGSGARPAVSRLRPRWAAVSPAQSQVELGDPIERADFTRR